MARELERGKMIPDLIEAYREEMTTAKEAPLFQKAAHAERAAEIAQEIFSACCIEFVMLERRIAALEEQVGRHAR